MQARVKQDGRWHLITSCGGVHFIKDEWRAVPPGAEEEAEQNPFLETQEEETEQVTDALPEEEAEKAPVKRSKK